MLLSSIVLSLDVIIRSFIFLFLSCIRPASDTQSIRSLFVLQTSTSCNTDSLSLPHSPFSLSISFLSYMKSYET